jgi:hypothetical protein
MNIFFLSRLIAECAAYHFNTHVSKMLMEACQLLSTAWAMTDPETHVRMLADGNAWKATHHNHPCAVWARAHKNNYAWLAALGLALCSEFQRRFSGAAHSAEKQLRYLAAHVPAINADATAVLIGDEQITEPPQCMPEEFRVPGDAVAAYRQYYQSAGKAKMRCWRPKKAPVDADLAQFTPPWFVAVPLAMPKYYWDLVERERKRLARAERPPAPPAKKRKSKKDATAIIALPSVETAACAMQLKE